MAKKKIYISITHAHSKLVRHKPSVLILVGNFIRPSTIGRAVTRAIIATLDELVGFRGRIP